MVMNVLVVGGTGLVGRHVAASLAMRGVGVRVVSRSFEKISLLRAPVSGVVADLNRPESLREAFFSIDALFLISPHTIAETGQGLAAVQAAVQAGVRKIVYMSTAMPPGATRIPHVASKAPIEHALFAAHIPYTILRPHDFFHNDRELEEAIAVNGVYPRPIGSLGIARVDVRDLADAAVNALLHSGHEGRIYTLGSVDALTGEKVAALYERYLGRRVRYTGGFIDEWEKYAASMPKWQRDDYRQLYRYLQDEGTSMDLRELIEQEQVVGHEPRRFEDFVASTCRQWRAAKMEFHQEALSAC